MSAPTGHDEVYIHVCPQCHCLILIDICVKMSSFDVFSYNVFYVILRKKVFPKTSNRVNLESNWTFVPNLQKNPLDALRVHEN